MNSNKFTESNALYRVGSLARIKARFYQHYSDNRYKADIIYRYSGIILAKDTNDRKMGCNREDLYSPFIKQHEGFRITKNDLRVKQKPLWAIGGVCGYIETFGTHRSFRIAKVRIPSAHFRRARELYRCDADRYGDITSFRIQQSTHRLIADFRWKVLVLTNTGYNYISVARAEISEGIKPISFRLSSVKNRINHNSHIRAFARPDLYTMYAYCGNKIESDDLSFRITNNIETAIVTKCSYGPLNIYNGFKKFVYDGFRISKDIHVTLNHTWIFEHKTLSRMPCMMREWYDDMSNGFKIVKT